MFVVVVNMVTSSASWVLDTGCSARICNDLQVLQRSRKLTKDEVVLRLGNGKAVAAEVVGLINLVISDRVMLELKGCYFVPSMIKNIISIPLLDNAGFEFLINKNCFYLMKDGSSHLLDVYGPLNTEARRGFSYFITFTDDHSQYDYVYLMRNKSEPLLLNIASSNTVAQMPQIWHGYYFYDPSEQKVFVSRNAVFLKRGMTGQLDNDPKTYEEAMSDIDSGKWLEAMKSEIDSMSSNQV
ncbi:hypothetical protein Sango_1243900 [Sesamum angolense]|uniref:Retrovirus-related Pol polyprotein from transposon TNT 1-94-like beta-barrel domain-containing protein n=1 Tax=Sesamum angolense TaxID=2727404 RepID=A0AAE2BTY3_9LAMI|nr:hypothetical protein Sango_1243900 [Sesamum angolense]